MSLSFPLMYFTVSPDMAQITNYPVTYEPEFIENGWQREDIHLFVVCISKKVRNLNHIKAGIAVLTSIPKIDPSFADMLQGFVRQSKELNSICGNSGYVFLSAKVNIPGNEPPTEQELLSVFAQQCLKLGSYGNA